MSFTPVRCRVCSRVRVESGDWIVTDVTLPKENDDWLCPRCANNLAANRALTHRLMDRRARRERREGRTDYGAATGDPFAGFRGEE